MHAFFSPDSFSPNMYSYQATLKQLFLEFGHGDGTRNQLASITMRIMQALQSNLDGKSKMYKDPALQCLFLMNNIHYIVKSVRRYVLPWVYDIRNLLDYMYLMLILILGQKQRIYWVMIGYKDTVGLYNKMRTSIGGLVGQRFVSINWSILADSTVSIFILIDAILMFTYLILLLSMNKWHGQQCFISWCFWTNNMLSFMILYIPKLILMIRSLLVHGVLYML